MQSGRYPVAMVCLVYQVLGVMVPVAASSPDISTNGSTIRETDSWKPRDGFDQTIVPGRCKFRGL